MFLKTGKNGRLCLLGGEYKMRGVEKLETQ